MSFCYSFSIYVWIALICVSHSYIRLKDMRLYEREKFHYVAQRMKLLINSLCETTKSRFIKGASPEQLPPLVCCDDARVFAIRRKSILKGVVTHSQASLAQPGNQPRYALFPSSRVSQPNQNCLQQPTKSKLARNEKLIRHHTPIGMRLLLGKIISLPARHRKSAAAFVLECVQVVVQ